MEWAGRCHPQLFFLSRQDHRGLQCSPTVASEKEACAARTVEVSRTGSIFLPSLLLFPSLPFYYFKFWKMTQGHALCHRAARLTLCFCDHFLLSFYVLIETRVSMLVWLVYLCWDERGVCVCVYVVQCSEG